MNPRIAIPLFSSTVIFAVVGSLWWQLRPVEREAASFVVPDEARPEGLPLAAPGSLPDLVLITIDTARADHFSPYGYPRKTTPFLAELADEGRQFDQAWSTSSWTLPSVASIITGSWPEAHGLTEGTARDWKISSQEALDPALPSLPETLQAMGYRTWGLTANGHLDARFGFARGFDRYTCVGFNDSPAVRQVLDQWTPDLQDGAPFFLWLHVFDPHAPYVRRDEFDAWYPGAPWRRQPIEDGMLQHALGEGTLTDAFVEEAIATYDSELRHEDALLRQLFDELPRAKQAVVLVTTDHGEEFGDHGEYGHRSKLYDELTRVPMIVRDPRDPRRGHVDEPVSLVDVFPTLVAAAGGTPDPSLPGVDVRGELDPTRAIPIAVSRDAEKRALVVEGYKLIVDLDGAVPDELYELSADPVEANNLADSQPDRVQAMRKQIEAHAERWTRAEAAPRVDLDASQLEDLEAMGYLNR